MGILKHLLAPMALIGSLAPSSASTAAEAEPAWTGPWKGIPELVSLLATVPEGKAILREAWAKDPAYQSRIHLGDASFTESTFARSYSLMDGQEKIELRHEVTLSRKLSLADAMVDLAHELVHFTEKSMLDPYKPGFTLKQFVRTGIEGQGGELSALERECVVAWSLKRRYARFPTHRLCSAYRSAGDVFLRERARMDYYALGGWYNRAPAKLKNEVPYVSGLPVIFTSSYARKPYPLALAEEFEATLDAACANNRRKYHLIAAQAEGGRNPSSDLLARERARLRSYDRLYCAARKAQAGQ